MGAYATKAATVLGSLHVLGGLVTLAASIVTFMVGRNTQVATMAIGVCASAFFFLTGGLAVGGARLGNRHLVVATLVMAIISAISAADLFTVILVAWSMVDRVRPGDRDGPGDAGAGGRHSGAHLPAALLPPSRPHRLHYNPEQVTASTCLLGAEHTTIQPLVDKDSA